MEFFKVAGALAAAALTIFSLKQLSTPGKSLSESNFLDNPCLLSTESCDLGKMNPVGPTYLVQPDPTKAGTSCIDATSPLKELIKYSFLFLID